MPVIKRYPNRKLYDTSSKQYITLGEIAILIQQGIDVTVIDYASDEDLTAATLVQIISEFEKKHRGSISHGFLHALIRMGGNHLSAIQRSLVGSLELYHLVEEEITRRILRLIHLGKISDEDGQDMLQLLINEPEASPAALNDKERLLASVKEPFYLVDLDSKFLWRHIPTRNDLNNLVDQLNELSSKLDDLSAQRTDDHTTTQA